AIANLAKGTVQSRSLHCAAALAFDDDLPRSLSGRAIQVILDSDAECAVVTEPEDPAYGGPETLARKMARWADDNFHKTGMDDLRLPASGRNWLPLIDIA